MSECLKNNKFNAINMMLEEEEAYKEEARVGELRLLSIINTKTEMLKIERNW